jgi:hypothetical protein
MPNLKPNFSYEIANTYVTDSGEGRIAVQIKYTESVEVDGSFVNSVFSIAELNFGVGDENPQTANVVNLLYSAVPKYFTD